MQTHRLIVVYCVYAVAGSIRLQHSVHCEGLQLVTSSVVRAALALSTCYSSMRNSVQVKEEKNPNMPYVFGQSCLSTFCPSVLWVASPKPLRQWMTEQLGPAMHFARCGGVYKMTLVQCAVIQWSSLCRTMITNVTGSSKSTATGISRVDTYIWYAI